MSEDLSRDDPDAAARLADAARAVASVFGGRRGEAWGDALPHHPHQTKAMGWQEVERLHERPKHLPVDALDWEEVHYFFSHAGYTMQPAKTLPAAIAYFLPRLAAFTVPPDEPACFGTLVIGEHLGEVAWQHWKAVESKTIRGWLIAWANAAIRCRYLGWNGDNAWSIYEPLNNRDPMPVLDIVARAGLSSHTLHELFGRISDEQVVRLAAHALIGPDRALYDAAYVVLDPWLATEATREALLRAALADRPWSATANLLLSTL